MIKISSPQKILATIESFSTYVPIIGEDLLKAFYSTGCFIFNFVIQVISEKTLHSKGFTSNWRDTFT